MCVYFALWGGTRQPDQQLQIIVELEPETMYEARLFRVSILLELGRSMEFDRKSWSLTLLRLFLLMCGWLIWEIPD